MWRCRFTVLVLLSAAALLFLSAAGSPEPANAQANPCNPSVQRC